MFSPIYTCLYFIFGGVQSVCKKNSCHFKYDRHYRSNATSGKRFENALDGKSTHYYVLKNKNGIQVSFTDYGAHLVGLLVPDKNGKLTDVAIGFDDIDGYKTALSAYYGATVGRYGNRIAKGHFVLDGRRYDLLSIISPIPCMAKKRV